MSVRWLWLLLPVFIGVGCETGGPAKSPQTAQADQPTPTVQSVSACPSPSNSSEAGKASYYADSLHGNSTASGEPYDKSALTAAHRTLPFGTIVCVTNLSNTQSVKVRINDRGPFTAGRIIDLSRAAAERVGLIRAGVAQVRVQILERP